ncbi:ATP-binding protein [Spirosoma luteum]|uniref:tetratricopeptide repeat-containing sensor histidine kinase n=1 Tax=Spirosoma luteum TaxID=431553 RepID=UPI00037C3B75
MTAYLSGLKIAEERKDKFGIFATSTITLYMGNIYSSLANYPQALANYEKALKGAEESGSKTGVVVSLNNIGNVYSEQGEYDKALDYRLKSLQLNEAMGFQGPPKELNFDNVGQSYLNLANYSQALTYLQNGLNISKANRNKTILVRSYNNLSQLYLKIAIDSNATSLTTLLRSNKTSTLQKASAYADSALVLAKEQGDLRYLYRAYQTRSQIQDALGDPQAALANYQDFIKTKDLVINQQNSNQIAVATLQYDFDKKETALQFQQQLTAAQLQKQTLLTSQQAQALILKAQAAELANKERDLQRLQYLQERAAKQDKEKQLALSQREQALKATALELSQTEVKNQTQQRTYLLAGFGLLAALLGFIVYGYAQKQKANTVLQRQKEEINQKSSQLEQSLAELKATQTQLVQKEKMASLGELTAGIAHEIQNPLNFVNNFSEVSAELVTELEEEQQKPNRDTDLEAELLVDLKQNLQKITHHGSRASAIVRGMLEHSRSSTGEKQPTNLNALADEYFKLAYHGLKAKDKEFNAELVTDFMPDLGMINVVPQEIGRVLLNLYNNAFYAVQQRSKNLQGLQDLTGLNNYQPNVTVSTVQANGKVEIRVSDNGTGIPEAVKAKIFQPFFTTKPTGEGTGLGLSLSYDIITKGHGGSLTVESQEGEGTTFVIQLPALN